MRHARFPVGINQVAPWMQLEQSIEPLHPKLTRAGHQPIGTARMLRTYAAQQCSGSPDKGTEYAIHDRRAIRNFVGVDPNWSAAPDAAPSSKFCHLSEAGELTRRVFRTANVNLAAQELTVREGAIVDATLTAASLSTKNQGKQCIPVMPQSKKGND